MSVSPAAHAAKRRILYRNVQAYPRFNEGRPYFLDAREAHEDTVSIFRELRAEGLIYLVATDALNGVEYYIAPSLLERIALAAAE